MENMRNELDRMCTNFLIDRAYEGYEGIWRCEACPLYKNGLCDVVFDEDEATEEDMKKAIELMTREEM